MWLPCFASRVLPIAVQTNGNHVNKLLQKKILVNYLEPMYACMCRMNKYSLLKQTRRENDEYLYFAFVVSVVTAPDRRVLHVFRARHTHCLLAKGVQLEPHKSLALNSRELRVCWGRSHQIDSQQTGLF